MVLTKVALIISLLYISFMSTVSASFEVLGLDEGVYEVEWWDTYLGQVIGKENIRCKAGKLHLKLPTFKTDIACKVRLKQS